MRTATSWKALEEEITRIVKQGRRAVAVSFRDSEPADVKKFDGTEPSGCSFWRLAAEGKTFYTVPENHFNCAVGAYTHNIALSPQREKETEQTLKMMFDLGYVKQEEVPQIPRLAKGPKAIVYSPMGDAHGGPDVVLFAVKPAGAMLLQERQIAQEWGRGHRRWEGRRAWRCRRRCNTERSLAWDASGIACTRGWGKMRCTW
jgi:uncharacterized protein (DUF169 family)